MTSRRRERSLTRAAAHDRFAALAAPRPWVPTVPWRETVGSPALPASAAPTPTVPPAGPLWGPSAAPPANASADAPLVVESAPSPPPPTRSQSPPAGRLVAAVRERLPVAVRAAAAGSALQRGHAVVLALVGVAGVVGALLLWQAARPSAQVAPPRAEVLAAGTPVAGPPAPRAAGPAASPSPGPVVVHVAGKVRRPGVVTLPPGARVVDAVQAAGGALPGTDLTAVNLARPLTDGEQVAVGIEPVAAAPPEPATGKPAPGASSPAGGEDLVDLNTATLEQLEALPGVGPVLAQRILDWREENGGFTSVEELGEVSGIGDARLADLRDRVRV